MTERSPTNSDRRGRPRRFAENTEHAIVINAAVRLMEKTGYTELSVVDILAETGLSTRSFYRHFDSKEALLVALIRREAESVSRSMERAISEAPGPIAALEAWLGRLLDTYFEPRQTARSALFTTPEVLAASPMTEELAEIRWIMSRPLADALRTGHEAQVLVSPNPEADALSVFALVGTLTRTPRANLENRQSVKDQVMRFAWPAFGLRLANAPVGAQERVVRQATEFGLSAMLRRDE